MGKDNDFRLVLKVIVLLFFLAFFIYPLLQIFLYSLHGLQPNFSYIFDIILSRNALLWNSLSQALVSTLFCVLIGVPAGILIAKRNFPFKNIINSLSLVPFVLPSVVVVLSFVIVFGNNGWINNFLDTFGLGRIHFLYGFFGIIFAHVFYNFPLVMRFVFQASRHLDYSMEESAKTLGADKLNVFFRITLPQLMPSILASSSLVFIYCFMSFAIVLTLGGLKFSTFEVEVYRNISRASFETGAILALFQFFILLVLSFLYLWISKKYLVKSTFNTRPLKKLSFSNLGSAMEVIFLISIFLFVSLPLFSLVVFAFSHPSTGEFSLQAFEFIFLSGSNIFGTSPLHAIFFSLLIASIASVLSCALALANSLTSKKIGVVELLLGASIAVSVITLAFGYYVSFGPGNIFVIAIAHSVLAFPFAYRFISNALARIDSGSIDAAKTLGAFWTEIFRKVQFPRIKGAILSSIAFGFAISLAELGIVLLLSNGIYVTIPVYIYRLLSTFNLFAASAMSLILIVVSFTCFYIIDRFSSNLEVF